MEAIMPVCNNYSLIALLFVSPVLYAVDHSLLVLKNSSDFVMQVELQRVSEFGKEQKKILLEEGKTLPILSFVNITDGAQAAAAAKKNPESIYQITIYLSPHLKITPLILNGSELAQQLQACQKNNNLDVVTVAIDIKEKRAPFNLWASLVPHISYYCGPYPHATEISCGWFDLDEKKLEDVCPTSDTPSAQRVIAEIIRTNPHLNEQQARNLYNELRLQSLIETDLYEGYRSAKSHFYFSSFANKITQLVNLVSRQIPQATAIEEGAYVIFNAPGFFKPIPTIRYEISDYQKQSDPENRSAIAQELVKAYKIHLMPAQGWQNTLKMQRKHS